MPDLVTHMASGLLLGSGVSRAEYTPALVVGSCLPDLLGRVPAYVMSFVELVGIAVPEPLMFGTAFMHLPLGLMLAGAILAIWAHGGRRLALWCLLMIGSAAHLVLDALQHHWGEAYMWFFPFSDWAWEAGIMGSEATVFYAPALLVVSGVAWRWRHGGQPWRGDTDGHVVRA